MTSQELTQELTQLFALGYGFLLLCGAIYAIVWLSPSWLSFSTAPG